MISEIIGTFVLIMAVLYIAAPKLTIDDAPVTIDGVEVMVGMGAVGALPIALVVTAIGLSLGGTTGYAINPARDLGPRIIHQLVPIKSKGSSDWAYSWIPVAGPTVGALIAAAIYSLAPVT
jgi:glycerol uptake facilitator protein